MSGTNVKSIPHSFIRDSMRLSPEVFWKGSFTMLNPSGTPPLPRRITTHELAPDGVMNLVRLPPGSSCEVRAPNAIRFPGHRPYLLSKNSMHFFSSILLIISLTSSADIGRSEMPSSSDRYEELTVWLMKSTGDGRSAWASAISNMSR